MTQSNVKHGIPTGFPSLDKAISGGFRAGELIVLGGDAATGTSSLALSIALSAASIGCIFLSGEMSRSQVEERAVAMLSGVPVRNIRQSMLTPHDAQLLADAREQLNRHAIGMGAITHTGVSSVAQAINEHPAVRLVVVDGLECLLTTSHPRDEELAFAVLSLKRLALGMGVAILLVSHLPLMNQERSDRRPRLADFGACGACAMHADLVLGLYREEIYVHDMAVAGAAELLVLKCRTGVPGYIDLFFVASALRFEDVLEGGGTPVGTLKPSSTTNTSLESVMLDLGIDDSIMGTPVVEGDI